MSQSHVPRYSYPRDHMRPVRAHLRSDTYPSTRARVLATFDVYLVLTINQLCRVLGQDYARSRLAAHVQRLVQGGLLLAERDRGRTGDRSRWRYVRVVQHG